MPNLALWKSNLRANLISGKPLEPYAQKSPPPQVRYRALRAKKAIQVRYRALRAKKVPKYGIERYAPKAPPSSPQVRYRALREK